MSNFLSKSVRFYLQLGVNDTQSASGVIIKVDGRSILFNSRRHDVLFYGVCFLLKYNKIGKMEFYFYMSGW